MVRGRGIGDRELERVLVEVASAVAWAEPGDLAAAVRAGIERREVEPAAVRPAPRRVLAPFRRPIRVPAPSWRAAVAVAAAVVVLATGALAISPSARHAVADWLGLGGERITVTPTPPPVPTRSPLPTPTVLGQGLDLGTPGTLAEARRAVGFRPLLPHDPAVGPPARVYVQTLVPDVRQVFLVWAPGPALLESDATGVGLLIGEFRASVDRTLVEKFADAGRVEFLRIDGRPAYWVEGLHEVSYVDRGGRFIPDTVRLAGNVLLWSRGGITFRLESALSKAEAIRLARSVR
jgi:hypothetical protein